MSSYIRITEYPNVVRLKDGEETFGKVEELTSKEFGAQKANLSRVTLWGPDMIHAHKEAEETYFCVFGTGEILLNDEIFEFLSGTRIIIPPGTLHAARPRRSQIVFLCAASPPFDPKDILKEVGRWSPYVQEGKEF